VTGVQTGALPISTAHAVHLARDAGITLIGLARPDGFELFTHPSRIGPERTENVA